eukprot:evm.model.NODE_5473_length_17566_cov_15.304053.4
MGSGGSDVGREGGAAWLQQQLPPPLQQPPPASYGLQVTNTTVTSGGNRGERDEGSSTGGGGGSDSNELGMGATLSRLGGLLGQGGGASGGMAVVAVNNLPESTGGEEVEKVKADLWALVAGVGQGPREVHLKVGASTAFVVLADAGDLGETVRRLDWTEYGGKKLRLARSNKRLFF